MTTDFQTSVTRILLVEDNLDHANLLRAILHRGGTARFHVGHMNCLSAALEYLLREEVDVILLDLGLPDASGLEGLERVHQMVPSTPVVVLTALADDELAIRALQKGAQDYLVKTAVETPQLLRTIRYAIERNLVVRELDSVTNQLRSANARLEKVALLDPLTEVLNRRGLQQALSREIGWARRQSSQIQALLLDLDDFKRINDTLGHAVGDVVLQEMAQKLRSSIRATDYVARIGGDEFLILLPQTNPEEGMRIAEKVRLAVAGTPLCLPSAVVRVTASVGVLTVSEKTPSIDELLSRMHFVLGASKGAGKNQVCQENNGGPFGGEGEVLSAVLQALVQGNSFRAVKEPIFRLADEERVGYEFLSRLSTQVFESPNDFFPLCLEANILTLVDHRCFKQCAAAAASLPASLRCHLNLFPSTILDLPIPHLLEALPSDRPSGAFCIEISEQQILGDPLNLAEPVLALKQAGLQIAFDDVGFGHSCLESLVFLEPDIIKIDKRCISGIAQNPARLRSLKRLLKLSSVLGAEVVAEGIESREDLDVLRYLGVPYGQGFLWGRPL